MPEGTSDKGYGVSATQAQAAVLEQVAARFDEVHERLRTMLSGLSREVESVRSGWQGRGGASFERVSLAWAEDQARLLAALAETAGAIRRAGKIYGATDDEAAHRVHQAAPVRVVRELPL
jgi:WXG100 family type VII secretion target